MAALLKGGGDFQRDFREAVAAELTPSVRRRGAAQMALKSIVILTWAIGSYLGLLLYARELWQILPLSVSLALALAGVGFSIQHDANHGAVGGRLGRVWGFSLDLMGASSQVWRAKHNHAHHTYTNIDGADTDIEQLPLARFAPSQPLYRFHRFQHLYMWFFYGLFAFKGHLTGDWMQMLRGQVGLQPITRSPGIIAVFIAGKILFITWAIALPLYLFDWWAVLGVFALVSWVFGMTVATVFQMAHCVEEAEHGFTTVAELEENPGRRWAEHQLASTVDFAPRNRVLNWYLGGLNFQAVHHLQPKVCHVHYARLSPVLDRVAAQNGLAYRCHPTLRSALASHGRWLRRMGHETVPVAEAG
ncbi:fatty acid desaturase family protein [Miltoncostaea oceani]|uniref:fatty acid desaturase family protein n=1 Tax=Miltoncostaea oceani TaxID=2843216 RepID=UPI001C3D4B76|nr:acyl-CoA desaturase [Miltoncostaea oceani]